MVFTIAWCLGAFISCRAPERVRLYYTCEDAQEILVKYPRSDQAIVFYDGYKHHMSLKQRGQNLVYEGRFYQWHVTLDRQRGSLHARPQHALKEEAVVGCAQRALETD